MKVLLFFACLMSASFGFAQDDRFPDEDTHFPGGNLEMKRFIQENTQYPEASVQNWDQGQVYVTFIVEESGRITNIDVMRGGLTPELNREAMRLVASMPKWVPAKLEGVAVRSQCRLPITFTLGGKPPRRIRRQQRKNR